MPKVLEYELLSYIFFKLRQENKVIPQILFLSICKKDNSV